MKHPFQAIYRQLQADVDQCRQRNLPELEQVECCFRMATACWISLRQELSHYRFDTEVEEIEFFKHIKPRFTSQIELYTLIYQGILFKPAEDPHKIASFWSGESERIDRFTENKEAFIQYYKSGDTHLDRQYFLRHSNIPAAAGMRTHDNSSGFSTSHDWLVAALLAQEMYHAYASDRLRELQ